MKLEQTEPQTVPPIDFRNYIVRLGAGRGTDELGGKGAGLDRLLHNGFSVPPGFVITPAAFTSVLEVNHRDLDSPGAIDETLLLPEALLDDIMKAIEELSVERVAVRSSAVGEDGGTHSFAGQYESVLSVPSHDRNAVSRALRHVWKSYFSGHAEVYRARTSGSQDTSGIAVVVQAMVDAEFSGVIFTVDPLGTRSGAMILNVGEGLGDRLVSGEITPEEYVVRRSGEISEGGGQNTLLDMELIAHLRDLALQIEKIAGGPQDIEFAIADREISILQARPITVVGTRLEGSDSLADVEPIPIAIVPPETGFWEFSTKDFQRPVTPLTVDLYIPPALASMQLFFETFGVPAEGMEVRSIGGNPYVRMVPPGGKDGPTPPAPIMKLLIYLVPMLRKSLKAARKVMDEGLIDRYVEQWYSEGRPKLDLLLKGFSEHDLSSMSDDDLFELLQEVKVWLREAFDAHFLTFPAHFLCASDLYFFAEEHLDWPSEKIGRLSYGISPDTSAGAQALGRLGQLATELLGTSGWDVEALEQLLSASDRFARDYNDYVDRWGLVIRSYDFDSPVEAESQREVLEQIHRYSAAGYDPDAVVRKLAERRESARDEARQVLRVKGEVLVEEFDRILSILERDFPVRDDTGVVIMRAVGAIRLIALEFGRRLARHSQLDRPEHIVYLEEKEIREGLEEGTDWRTTVAHRRGERKWAEMNPGPLSYGKNPGDLPPARAFPKVMQRLMRGMKWVFDNDMSPMVPDDEDTAVNGTPASAGIVTGRVRVVRSAGEFGSLTQGDILVCPVTTPAWASVFPVIGGIVTDFGGVLSHPAIIAREFGIPAVVGTGTATTRLQDGDLVRLDGSTGRVEILPSHQITPAVHESRAPV